MSDYREQARARVKDKSTGDRFKLVEGDNLIRILPNALDKKGKAPKPPYKEYNKHYNVGVGEKSRSVICGKDVGGDGECWLCDRIEADSKSEKKQKRVRADAMKSVAHCAFQIAYMDRDTEKLRGPVIFNVTEGKSNKSLDARLLGLLGNQRKMIADPIKGYNIHIERTGTGRTDTRYGSPDLDEEPTPVPSKILEKLKSFSELIPEYSEKFAKAAYYGEDPNEEEDDEDVDKDDDDDDDDDSNKKGKKKMAKASKKRKHDDEDEDIDEEEDDDVTEDDDDDDDDDDDEPKKKGKSKDKKKSKKSKDDDDDEDEEEEDDEEEESDDDDEEEESDDDDEEDEPKKKSKKSSVKKKSKKDEDDEDDDDEDDEDDDDEDEKPKKKSKKSKDDDDDDEDEEEEDDDDEEDEEEEKPMKKGKKKTAKKKSKK